MVKKIWRYLTIVLSFVVIIETYLLVYTPTPKVYYTSLGYAVDEAEEYGSYTTDFGYINDAQVAAQVGGSIIDDLCKDDGKTILPFEAGEKGTRVEYDAEARLWRISKGYFFHRGAVVVITQDTGEVILAYFQKQIYLQITISNGVTHNYLYASGQLLRETYGGNTLDFFYDANGYPYALKYNAQGYPLAS